MVANLNKSNIPIDPSWGLNTQTSQSLHFFIASQFFPARESVREENRTSSMESSRFNSPATRLALARTWGRGMYPKKVKGTV